MADKTADDKLAAIELDIEVGDTLLGGRFKNIPLRVEDIGTDENGQPTVNGRKLLAFRIKKHMPKTAQSLIDIEAPDISYRGFDDVDGQRRAIYDNAKRAFENQRFVENATHRLEIADVDYDDDYNPTLQEEKEAILRGRSLQRPLKGTYRLVDKGTGSLIAERRATVAHIPHLNSRGMFIRNGVAWSVRNQTRLRPGVYTRKRTDGGTETQFNVRPGTGRGFRVHLEPRTGIFKLDVGQSSTRLYPILRALGISDDEIKEQFGEELFQKNYREPSGHDQQDLEKLVKKLGRPDLEATPDLLAPMLKDILARAELDEETTELTLKERIKNVEPKHLLRAAVRALKVSRDEEQEDNRDSQAFQSFHSAEDFVRERLERDPRGTLRKVLFQAARNGSLDKIPSGALNKSIASLFEGTGLAQTTENINPIEDYDQRQAVTRLGDGGMSIESVSRPARNVQASYLGVIDAGRGPESDRLGLDMRLTDAAVKGSDGRLYTRVRNVKTGEIEYLSARDLASKRIAFPGELEGDAKRVAAIANDTIDYVHRDELDYELVSPNDMLSRASSLIPFPEGVKGQRLLMGARMSSQALPLEDPEAPLVQTANADGQSVHGTMGKLMGARYADAHGVVTKVTPDFIELATPEGKKRVDLYNNYPNARKTMLHNTPTVQVGQPVMPGQLLARSNFTDKDGTVAIGKNLRVAYTVAEGSTIEDAFVISESAAKKLTSQTAYKQSLDMDGVKSTKTKDYQAVYAEKFKPDQFAKMDDDGVIRVGETVHPGDPIILAIGEKQNKAVGAVMESPRSTVTDKSVTWDHKAPGTVVDVHRTAKGVQVLVNSYDMMHSSDKLANRFGGKGVISEIRPDDQMPVGEDGQPIEVLANSLGIISRTNPSALAESLLGKVAAKTGKPYVIPPFKTKEGMANFAIAEALKHGVIKLDEKGNPVDTEVLTDPRDGRKIPGVFTGVSYFMKLHHTAESKLGARDTGGYTFDGFPARGGKTGSKRIGLLDTYSLVSAGATEFLKDAKLIRGQRNDDYWRAVRNGETPVAPTESFASDQFKTMLRAAGVSLRERGTRTGLGPMTDKEVDQLAAHEIQTSDTFDFETMRPIEGGLFDMKATGGASGTRFAKITLPKKVPHPLMEEGIRRLLGVTGKQLDEILAGREKINGRTGPEAVEEALANINVDREIAAAKVQLKTARKGARDIAVKRLNYLAGLKKTGVLPSELMIEKLPVIPARFRPIMRFQGKELTHDLNYLYKDVLESKKNYTDAQETFGDAGDEYLTLRNAVHAVSGMRDPVTPKHVEDNVKGILKTAIGVGTSPKLAMFQRRVIGSAVDTVGRGTITSDANLDMDEVGIPRGMARKIYRPYVIRQLVRNGMPASEAVTAVLEQRPEAEKALEDVVKERPVVYNRAPALHRYNYVAAWPKLRDDDAIGMPYHTLKGANADYDGDNINVHVPSSKEAVDDVLRNLLPSRNLFHAANFQSHIEPTQDYIAGLYLASTPDTKQKPVIFATAEDAKKAYARGEISARTPIRILNS